MRYLLLIILILLGSYAQALDTDNSSKSALIKEKKVINMCVDPNWMPLEKIDKNGNYIGLISDYAKLISKNANLEFKLVKTKNYKQSLEFLRANRCDIIMAEVATPERKKEFLTTKPYYVAARAYVTHNDTPWVSDFSHLVTKNTKIGVAAESPAEFLLKEWYKDKGINIVTFNSVKDGLEAVSSKHIIAYVNIIPVVAYEIQKYSFNNIKISGFLKSDVKLSIMINKNLPWLLPKLNSAIDKISEEDRLRIFDKWIKVKLTKEVDYTILIYMFIIFSIISTIILIAYIRQRKLKKEIEKLNESLEARVSDEVKKNREKDKLMLQQSRFAQMGEMISMIAHQWRQPLNVLSMLNQSIVIKYNKKKLDEEFIKYFQETSNRQIRNMSQTIDDFRSFFRPQKHDTRFSINEVIKNMLNIITPLFIKNSIEIELEEKEECFAKGHPNEIGQAVINIINNAKDALIENDIEHKYIKITIECEGAEILLSIKDNGGGIPKDIMPTIFDPYFTTKHKSHGTGIGLFMSKRIIEQRFDGILENTNRNFEVDEEKYFGASFSVKIKLEA